MIDKEKLLRNPPPSFGVHPPWVPVATFAAANFLNVHAKTLLAWNREGIGPQPIDKQKFLYNQLYWLPGNLLRWWEETALGKSRSYQDICHEWAMANTLVLIHGGKSEMRPRELRVRGRGSVEPLGGRCGNEPADQVEMHRRLRFLDDKILVAGH